MAKRNRLTLNTVAEAPVAGATGLEEPAQSEAKG
jgi:hypothetical protein